jgi:hypothetical protein
MAMSKIVSDPSILHLLAQIREVQAYPMPRTLAKSIDVAEQVQQKRALAKIFLNHFLDWGRDMNEVVRGTDKVIGEHFGEFSDTQQDSVETFLGRFKRAEEALEEEEQAA